MSALTPADEQFLRRTLELALRGGNAVFPNPRVGAVLVAEGKIIGEGWHERFGGPHAEVNAFNSCTAPELLSRSTLYVSLEPCNHQGKTPPCSELIVQKGVPRVVVGSIDPNVKVMGAGIARLRGAGVEVIVNEETAAFQEVNRGFWVNQQQKRPYVVLKWAETADGKIGNRDAAAGRLMITGAEANQYTHTLRAQVQAVLVGAGTAITDDPQLTVRLTHTGRQPLRLVLDPNRRILEHPELRLLTDGGETWLLLEGEERQAGNLREIDILKWGNEPSEWIPHLFRTYGVGSVLVEGGAATLQAFLDADCWDEIHVLRSPDTAPEADVSAPKLSASQALALMPKGKLGKDALWVASR